MPDESDSRHNTRAGKTPDCMTLDLDVVEEAGDWSCFSDVDGLIQAAGRAVAAHPHVKNKVASEACIALSDDASVRKLNATYRAKDKPTNVLSFPATQGPAGPIGSPRSLGDIVLALETVLREAREQDITPQHHLQHLIVHGLLHLHGYDHESDDEADEMEALEIEILATIGIANPYVDTAETA